MRECDKKENHRYCLYIRPNARCARAPKLKSGRVCANIRGERVFQKSEGMTRKQLQAHGLWFSDVTASYGYRVRCCRRWQHMLPLVFLLLAVFICPALLAAQETDVHIVPRKPPESEAKKAEASIDPTLKTHTKPIKVDVDLVLVPVTITDPLNRLVTGLERQNFQVYEGDTRQEIRHFSSEDSPISLGVIFDMSGSMTDKIEKSREAVVEFFKTANPQDEFFLVTFADKPEILADFSKSIEDIQNKLIYTVPKGKTALLDAIYLGINRMKNAEHQRKALLIISDGGDNNSRYTENEIKSIVREADVQIYAIGIFDPTPRTEEERTGPILLSDITDVTGGRTFTINDVNELSDVASKIGIELRNQYVLGYRPKNPVRDGKWRKIKVKLNPPKGLPPLHVFAKTGYYAPRQQ
jgi:Ca-activated chloride channel family protein